MDKFRLRLVVISDGYSPLLQVKLPHLVHFKAHSEVWNTLSTTVADTFHGPGGYSKPNFLLDRDHFRRSRVWQIYLVFNTTTFYQKRSKWYVA